MKDWLDIFVSGEQDRAHARLDPVAPDHRICGGRRAVFELERDSAALSICLVLNKIYQPLAEARIAGTVFR